jgi:hypothetical protein
MAFFVSSLETMAGQTQRSIKSASWKLGRQALVAMADFAEVTVTVMAGGDWMCCGAMRGQAGEADFIGQHPVRATSLVTAPEMQEVLQKYRSTTIKKLINRNTAVRRGYERQTRNVIMSYAYPGFFSWGGGLHQEFFGGGGGVNKFS